MGRGPNGGGPTPRPRDGLPVRETVYRKRHPFDLWIRRTGLSEAEIAALVTHILEAPDEIRQILFEIDGGKIAALLDRKLIFRAEPMAPG
jgi:hypothetical protein